MKFWNSLINLKNYKHPVWDGIYPRVLKKKRKTSNHGSPIKNMQLVTKIKFLSKGLENSQPDIIV